MREQDPLLQLITESEQGYKAHWIYTEHGRKTLAVARYVDYKGDKTYRQFFHDAHSWKKGMPPLPYPLYGLDTLQNRSLLDAIFICEGEKCARLLQQLRWPSVSTVLGAGNISKSDFTPLRYFNRFIILRDNDAAGIKYALEVATVLRRMQENCEIYVCNIMNENLGDDLIDWVVKHPLYGYHWDGFADLEPTVIGRVETALLTRIKESMITIEECPQIAFKADLTLFDSEPKPLEQKLKPIPAFPLTTLPPLLADYVSLLARQKSIPVDFPATSLLAITGGIIGRQRQLCMRPGQRWVESANVWAILVGRPSTKKSPTLRELFVPIGSLEKAAQSEYKAAFDAYKSLEKTTKEAKKNVHEEEPRMRRYLTDDCTTAKLRELFSQNHGGLILRSDELKGQLEKLDKDGHEGDRSFMLQCWSGLDFYNEDRIARGSSLSIPLTLTWIGCIPPTSLSYYLSQATSESAGSDGLMQRFQMVSYPDFTQKFVLNHEPLSEEQEEKVQQLFIALDKQMRSGARMLHFADDAQTAFDTWLVQNENSCRSGGHPTYWESHLGKLSKLVGSLSIILHNWQEILEGVQSEVISLTSLQSVFLLTQYYIDHAQRCYDSTESIELAAARKILDLVQKGKLGTRFKAADIYGNSLGGLKNSRHVTDALQLLKDLRWAALDRRTPPNGRPSEDWVIHPNIQKKP